MPPARIRLDLRSAGALLLAALAAAPASAAEVRNLARGVVHRDDKLEIAGAAASVEVDVAGWTVLPVEATTVVALRRLADDGPHVRVLDRAGNVLGESTVPEGWGAIVTDAGIVLVPDTPHSPVRPHWLRFTTFSGEVRREVYEPGLELVSVRVAPGGRIATISTRAQETEKTALAYDAGGAEIARRVVDSPGAAEAILAAGGRRLVVLARDATAQTATLAVVRPGRRRKPLQLPNPTNLVADPRGARVAAVGPDVVALLDGRTGKLLWRRDRHLGHVVGGGVRFDRHVPRLVVVSAEIDHPAGKAHVALRTFHLGTGAERRAPLAETPADALPHVIDVEPAPAGRRRVVLHDRVLTAEAPEPVP